MDTAPARDAAENAKGDRAEARLAMVAEALADRYRVEREVGRGGMATVYLAEDLRHRRRVAVKVLHAELGAALGAERFLREIGVTAALHHPHLLPLHDSGEARGLLYYVMPFIEGESLRQRLVRERQLAVDDAVRITTDVASALDYAHRRGFIHRDVKPENVLLHDGRALVADFGIARAVQGAADGRSLTGTGVSIGTPQYMSPEQAAGERDVDARTDVFALGVVLYEMLAGTPPFTAPTLQGVVAKVMTEQPRPISTQRSTVPGSVAAAVTKALEKLPADRFATAAQFAAALAPPGTAAVDRTGVTLTPAATPAPRGRLTRRDIGWAAVATALAAGAFVTGLQSRRGDGGAAERPVRFTLAIADTQRLAAAPAPVAISPDGRTIAYVGEAGPGRRALYRRNLDDLEATRIAGTEGAARPFFSDDGEWIAFTDDLERLKKIPTGGGNVQVVAELSGALGSTWGPGGVIVAGSAQGLVWLPATGGPARPLTAATRDSGELRHADPMFLPDGKTVAFRISQAGDVELSRIGLATVDFRSLPDSGVASHTTLDTRGGTPLGFADGLLVVGHPDGAITAVRVDVRRRTVIGPPVTVLDRVDYNRGLSAALSHDGSLVYVRGVGGGRLTLVDERGATVGGSDERRRFQHPRFSPDGRRVAVQVVSPEAARSDIWIYDLATSALSPLTVGRSATRPVWMPDGKRVAYIVEGRDRAAEVWSIPADRGGPEERVHVLPPGSAGTAEVDFSRVAPLAVLRAGVGPPRTNDLWLLARDRATGAPGVATRLAETPFSETMPRISPDGRWLAYVSNESGEPAVYVRPFPGRGDPVRVSSGGASEPVWSPDGQRIFYRIGDRFVATPLTVRTTPAGTELVGAEPRVLFEGRYVSTLPSLAPPYYDVHPDGRRFIVVRPTSEEREVVVVLDWLAEVRARVVQAVGR